MSVTDLSGQLSASHDAEETFRLIDEALAVIHDDQVREALCQYALEGAFSHAREHIAAVLSRLDLPELEPFMYEAINDDACRYWAIEGLARLGGKRAYPRLVELMQSESISVSDRAQVVKCLARSSHQPFDRDLPSDPEYWEEREIRVDEVLQWADHGFPDGTAYASPRRHPALDKPTTPLEIAVAEIESSLARERADEFDPANPSNCLVVATSEVVQGLARAWGLPAPYVDFLTRFSPMRAMVRLRCLPSDDEELEEVGVPIWLNLVGVDDFVETQGRYQEEFPNWPSNLVVIAHSNGDPFVLRLDRVPECSVLFSDYCDLPSGFRSVADSLQEFLQRVASRLVAP